MHEFEMSVSPIVGKDGKKSIYVQFSDGARSAEGRLPDAEIIRNEGFCNAEVEWLKQYLKQEEDTRVEMAKGVNAMDVFLNQK